MHHILHGDEKLLKPSENGVNMKIYISSRKTGKADRRLLCSGE